MGIINSRAETAQGGILLKGDGVCFFFSEIILPAFFPHSPLFFLYIYLYANKQQCHLETTSSALQKTVAPAHGICRKTARPQVPAAHEYAALTFETLGQI